MDKDTIRLGVIGIGISNMASTLVLLKDEPDLRYQITAACAGSAASTAAACARHKIPFACADYRELGIHETMAAVQPDDGCFKSKCSRAASVFASFQTVAAIDPKDKTSRSVRKKWTEAHATMEFGPADLRATRRNS